MSFRTMVVAAALMAGTAIPAHAAGSAADALDALSKLNVITIGDYEFQSGGETEGKVFVGGNFLGSNSTQIGFGGSQGTTGSTWATATVLGRLDMNIQIRNDVGGSYGAYVGGNANGLINVQATGGTIEVGGNAASIDVNALTTLKVVGNFTGQNGLDLDNGNTVHIGGSVTRIQGGGSGGHNVKVQGAVTNLVSLNDNSTGQFGSTIASGSTSNNVTVTALGNVANFQMNGTTLLKVNGQLSNSTVSGNGSQVYALSTAGNINNNTGNPNALQIGQNVFSGPGAPAPTAPGVPVLGGISVNATQMAENFAALQSTLKNLSQTNHAATASCIDGNGGSVNCSGNGFVQTATFGATSMAGYSVVNVDQTIFRANQFAYSISGSQPVIINVVNSGGCSLTATCDYNFNSNFINNARDFNRQVIWNFSDAKSVILNREFNGSLIAALADVQQVSSNFEGSLVAKKFFQKAEVHLGTYSGGNAFVLGNVPEPSQWTMLIAGFGLLGGALRRRRTFAVAA